MRCLPQFSVDRTRMPLRGRRPTLEAMESRLLLANLSITDLRIVDANLEPMPAPVIGQKYLVEADWTTTDLTGADIYIVRISVDGIPLETGTIGGSAGTNLKYLFFLGGWYAASGPHKITATVDADSKVIETSESDNTMTLNFTPSSPDIPVRMMWPLGNSHDPEIRINNYNDVDPRANSTVDYAGGTNAYDGHDAFDIDLGNAARMDAGRTVYAAAAGTVIAMADGNFDRHTDAAANYPANYVAVDLGNGWVNYYYHLKAWSVAVKPGDVVVAGQPLGLVGSSGTSTAAHLHFSTYHRGLAVETMYDPTAYFFDPPLYRPIVAPCVTYAGVSNGPIGTDFSELPQTVAKFPVDKNWDPDFWYYVTNIPNGAYVAVRWYRPDGSLYTTFSYKQTGVGGGCYNWVAGGTSGMLGTWQVALEIDNVELTRRSFSVTPAGSGDPEIRVESDSTYIINGRSTAIDLGTVQAGAAAPAKSFVVKNSGASNLTLSKLRLPADVSLLGTFPAPIAAGSSATFTLALDSTLAGTKFGEIHFSTNDSDEGDFHFNLSGTVTGSMPAGSPLVVLPAPAMVYLPGSAPQLIDPLASIADSSPGSIGLGTMQVGFVSGGRDEDRLGIRDEGTATGQISVSGNTILLNGSVIATFSGGIGASPLRVAFAASANAAMAQTVLRNVTYADSATGAITVPRYIGVSLTDSAGLVADDAMKCVIFDGRTVSSIVITPAKSSIVLGEQIAFAALGTMSDGTTRDLASLVNWSSSSTTVAAISRTGLTTSLTSGITDITAKVGSTSQSTSLQVLAPATPTLKITSSLTASTFGQSLYFTVSMGSQSGWPAPAGKVQFLIDGANFANPVPIVNGSATSQAIANLNVDTHTITATYSGDVNYVASAAAPLLLPVAKAHLTVAANPKTRLYGSPNIAFTATFSGLVLNQDASVLGGSLAISTLATASSHVGLYDTMLAGLSSNDYAITYVAGLLEIKPAPLTISAAPAARAYGSTNPTLKASYSGFVLNQDASALSGSLTLTTAAVDSSHVGLYTITPGGLSSSDYAITYKAGSLSVTHTPLTVTADSATRPYGSANPALSAVISGFVLNQNAGVLSGALTVTTAATSSSHVGHYASTPGGLVSSDYAITYRSGDLAVTPVPIFVSANSAIKTYGAANPAFSVIYSGFVLNQNQGVLTGTLALVTPATAASHVGNYPVTPGGLSSPDYSIVFNAGSLSVIPAPLTISADNNSIHFGAAIPTLTASYAGFVNRNTPASLATLPALSTLAKMGSPSGTYAITITGASSADYSIDYRPGTLNIKPPPLVVVLRGRVKTIIVGKKPSTVLLLSFSGDLDPASAQTIGGYSITTPGRDGKYGTKDDSSISILSATYDTKARTVTIRTKTALTFKPTLKLRAIGQSVRDRLGRLIDGNGDGKPGGDAIFLLTSKSL